MLALPRYAVASRGAGSRPPSRPCRPSGTAPQRAQLPDRSGRLRNSFGARPSPPFARRFALRVVKFRPFAAALGLAVAIAAAGSVPAPATRGHEGIGLERFM